MPIDPLMYDDEADTAPRSDDDDDEEDAQLPEPEEDAQLPEPEDIVPNKMSTIKPCDD
jgi:hypothetical protein